MKSLDKLYEEMLLAAKGFGKTADDMVYGEGDPDAKLMLIGEAPGAEETKLSRPFVGKAGKNLDEFLKVICRQRPDIYITNVVKFRPYKVSDKGRLSNRPPKREEIDCMRSYLFREIEAVRPNVVVTLGNVPLRTVLGQKNATIGKFHAVPTSAVVNTHRFKLFPLYHPASIIYNRKLAEVYNQDLLELKQLLEDMS